MLEISRSTMHCIGDYYCLIDTILDKYSHRSASGATNSDEHGIASLLLEDSRDSSQMLDAVLEEDEVHWRILQVVEG